MDKRQKSTLQSLNIKIADDLMPNEDFYAALLRDKIFTDEMLDIIKAQETRRKRVYKLLELLQKRGPDAFDNFVQILKENYQWLATELDKQHKRKLKKSQQGKESNEQNHKRQEKQYKDACMSPIGIIESSRKPIPEMSSPTHQQSHTKEETQSATDSFDQGFDEIPSQTGTVTSSTNDDVESQIASTTEVQSECFGTVSENIDAVGLSASGGLEESDDDFQTSEAYYDCVRRGSSRLSHLNDDRFHQELRIQDDENNATRSEISYEQSEGFQNQLKAMRELYNKLNATASENDDTEDLKDEIVTWKRIHIETDKLISRLENSDDTKMIKKCYERLPEKDKQQSLNVCFERLFADKKYLESRLGEQKKEEKQLLDDLFEQRGYMKKMEKTLADKEAENKNLKTSLDNLEKDVAIKHEQMEEKDAQIQKLQSRLLELQTDQQKMTEATARRGMAIELQTVQQKKPPAATRKGIKAIERQTDQQKKFVPVARRGMAIERQTDQHKKPAAAMKRGTANQRPVFNAQGRSPRRNSFIQSQEFPNCLVLMSSNLQET